MSVIKAAISQQRRLGKFKKRQVSGISFRNGKQNAVQYIHMPIYEAKVLLDKGISRIKVGITGVDSWQEYESLTIRNEAVGKLPIWWDDNFIDNTLSYEVNSKIIAMTDNLFKQRMKEEGYQSRDIHKDKKIGTEYVESNDLTKLIEVVKFTLKDSYRIAYERITGKHIKPIKTNRWKERNGQNEYIINPIVKHFLQPAKKLALSFYKAILQAPGGSGKTLCSVRIAQLVCKALGLPFKLLFISNKITNALQSLEVISKYYPTQTGKKLINIIIVGSINENDYRVCEAWATIIRASNYSKLEAMLKYFHSTNEDCVVVVVNKSLNSLLITADKIKINFKNWFTIADEVRGYCSEKGVAKLVTNPECALVNPKYSHLFGRVLNMDATPINRGKDNDNQLCVYNDDNEKFGKLFQISDAKARELGWVCDTNAFIIQVPSTPEYETSIKENRPFLATLCGITYQMPVQYYAALYGFTEFLIPMNKGHFILLTLTKESVRQIAEFMNTLKDNGILDNDFDIIEGYANKGNAAVKRFNRADKAILIATRWIYDGADTVRADCLLPLYNLENESDMDQFEYRNHRVFEGKVGSLVFCAMANRLEDSSWFKLMEKKSNGIQCNIISDSEFKQILTQPNPIVPIASPHGLGPNSVANMLSNITVITASGGNKNPIVDEDWSILGKAISFGQFTDEDGNSLFSKLVSSANVLKEIASKEELAENVFVKDSKNFEKIVNRNLQNEAFSHTKDWNELLKLNKKQDIENYIYVNNLQGESKTNPKYRVLHAYVRWATSNNKLNLISA